MPEAMRIIPLGGLGEVGKNMTVYEYGDDAIVVDAGLAFPRDEHLGVDLILPDFGYLRQRERPVRAVILTHAHEDHVGSLPYLLREVRVDEVWATRLTLGLVKSKLDEHGLLRAAELREIDPEGDPLQLGAFRAEFVRMAHSVPDAVAVGRKVCVVGRSMRKNLNIARNLGYIEMPEDALIRPVELDDYEPGQVLILCTGSQGEPLSALVRIAYNDHPAVHVERGDTVIISARPVPGNELRVHDAINQLAKLGAEVLHQENAPVHLSEDGVLIVVATLAGTNGRASAGPPELIARGFADSGPLLDEMRDEASRVLDDCLQQNIVEIKLLQEHIHDGLGQLVYDRTGRRPMILPVVVEV